MSKIPFFSIIIPVYNVEQYLDECMASVLNQTYTNLEVVLVDAVNMQVLGKSTLNGKSSSFVFKNDTPAAILPELTKRYVEGLFLHL